ncbi:MAG TPA: LacI family DNA-binding transcriptional regulator [Candidatus Acidoferrales bacterium]|nr:LacI family DNA-binding transcriptional regulator [Candidatus Acidoferrales bacterium]
MVIISDVENALSIHEVARRAKVSIATVSRTINGVPSVAPQLSRRVWRVIEELGYYPNTQARSLVSGRSRIFGLIVSEITNPFFPEIVQGFEDIAVQHNYEILTTSTVHDPKRVALSVRRMIERRVEGVAIVTFGMEEALFDDLKSRKIPLVFIDVGPPLPRVSNIKIDYLHGIRQAVQHLAALCHKNIAFISGPLMLKSAVARQRAFIQSMQEIGLPIDEQYLIEGNHTMEGGMEALKQILLFPKRPTAVICSNDMTAIGVMRQGYEAGLRIPQDLSLVGFDDIRLAQFIIPPLTTIKMSQTEIARMAFNALLAEVQRPVPSPNGSEYVLRTSLMLRDSTAMAPDAAGRPKSVIPKPRKGARGKSSIES